MATMPTIDFGNRQLETPGGLITPETNTGASRYRTEMGRDIQRTLETASRALYGIAEIKDRADERDARYAMQQAENWFNSKWNGTDAVGADGKSVHTPGVADRDFRQMEMDGTDSMTECRKLKTEFRDTDIYKNLGAGARNHFDRQFAIYEGKLDLAAAENHRKLAAQKIKVQTEADAVHTANGVQMNFGADDVTFENSASWGATQMTRLKLGSLVENGEEIAANDGLRLKDMVFRGGKKFDELKPEEQKYVKDIYEESVKNFRLNRIKSLADAASTGNGLGALRPEQCIDKALEMTFVMNGAGYGFRPDGTKKGTGWLGTMTNGNGQAVSELSFQSDAVKVDGKRIDIPMLVPGLTKEEIDAVKVLSEGGKPDEKIIASAQQKAVDHAKKQIDGGKSVWKDSGTGVVQISDAERNELLGYIDKAGKQMVSVKTQKQAEAYQRKRDEIGMDILKAKNPKEKGSCEIDFAKKSAELLGSVRSGEIDGRQAEKLMNDYRQYARQVFYNREDAILSEEDPKKRKAMYLVEAEPFKQGDPRFYKTIVGIANRNSAASLKGDKVIETDLKRKAEFLIVPPRNATKEQMEEYIAQRRSLEYEYREAFERGLIRPEIYKGIRTDLASAYDEEDTRAIQFFNEKFGLVPANGFDSEQTITSALNSLKSKDGTKLNKWFVTLDGKEYNIGAENLRNYRNEFLAHIKELRKTNPTASSLKLAEESYLTIKEMYVKDQAKYILGALSTRDGKNLNGLDITLRGIQREEDRLSSGIRSEVKNIYPSSVRDLAASLVDLDDGKDASEEMEEVIK